MFPAVVETRPQDEHFGLLNGARALVLDVINVNDFLAEFLFKLVFIRRRLGDVVLDVLGLGGSSDAPVGLDGHGNANAPRVVLMIRSFFRVRAVGRHQESELGQLLVLILLSGL